MNRVNSHNDSGHDDSTLNIVVVIIIKHTHPFNGPLSGTTQVSRYQKGKTNLDFIGARDSEWQWHKLGHMQVCTSLQTNNHASTPPLSFYRPDALPAAHQSTEGHALKAMWLLLLILIIIRRITWN